MIGRNFILSFISVFSFSLTISQDTILRPKLVVGIVVDQMRYDYLYRYWNKYGQGGFKRLVTEGFSCENLHYNYVPTNTAPGHSSIYTGTTPALHGIISNEWHQRYSRVGMYCVDDESVSAVGGTEAAGKMSPKNLIATTITDELRLFTNHQSKVLGVSLKDRGAILPAGHRPSGAYWFDSSKGVFMTSTYYVKELPQWVKKFNDSNWPIKLMKQGWNTLLPISQYTESMADDNPYEGKLGSENKSVFPRVFNTDNPSYSNITNTPHGNTLITQFAKESILAESMGQDGITDFLAISYSSTDYAGHMFGLHSVEIEDMYLRLDLELSELLTFLDTKVGHQQYLVFLSADHAVAQVPQLLKDKGYPGDYFNSSKLIDTLKKITDKKYGGFVIDGHSNQQIYLNEDRILNKKINREAVVEDLLKVIKAWPGVIDAFESKNIPYLSSVISLYHHIQLGYFPPRSGDLVYYIQPGWFASTSKTGTTHGAPYNYDTHVPALFYGWHIPSGKSYERYAITDIAPTISHLIKIPLPSASIGSPIKEIVK